MMKKAKIRLLTRAARNRAVVFAATCRAATVRESVPEAFFSSLLEDLGAEREVAEGDAW
jgi:hypothetical protein